MNHLRQPFTRRALVLLGLALAVIVTLPGCSGLLGLGAEPVTIKFAYLDGAADYGPLAEAFHEKYPNITVELNPVKSTGGPGANPVNTLIQKAEEVDAIRIGSISVNEKLVSGFLPLDTYITTDKNFPSEDLISGSLKGLNVGGKQLGIPASVTPYVIFYDPAMFLAKGVTPPAAGWTLEDFMTTAMAMTSTDEAAIGTSAYTYGFCSNVQFGDPIMFAYVFGGGIVDSLTALTAPTLNSQANIESLTWYASLRNEFGIMPSPVGDRQVGELVIRSNCGFWMDWLDRSWFGGWMNNREVSALPLPNYGSSQYAIATLDTYSIMAESLHPDETWKWLRFLLDQPTASGSLVPPRWSIIDNQEFTTHAASDVVGVAQSLPQQTIILGLELYQDPRLGEMVELYANATINVLNQETDAMTALDNAQQQAEQLFDN